MSVGRVLGLLNEVSFSDSMVAPYFGMIVVYGTMGNQVA